MRRKRKSLTPDAPLAPVPSEILDQFVRQDGRDAVLQVLPTTFNWPLFWVALLLMASPAFHQVAFLPTKKSLVRRL